MNKEQNAKYWRRWGAVCRLNQWRWLKGRVSESAVRTGEHHAAIWAIAENLANQSCRAVVADDLRHACHIHALGKNVSSLNLTNRQFDRLLLLWGNERDIKGLLIEPVDISALMAWEDPARANKNSLIEAIRRSAGHDYICKISTDIWGTSFWEDLDAASLLGLLRKIKGNHPAVPGHPF